MGERTVPSMNSLVKYDNPVLVKKHEEKKPVGKMTIARPCSPTRKVSEQDKETKEILNAILPPREWEEEGNRWLQQVLPGQVALLNHPVYEDLTLLPFSTVILLRQCFISSMRIVWLQHYQLTSDMKMVSSVPATRLDVINLQEQLDMRLQQRQARETGICPVRRELYTQCFDELIRQVTINCAERGLLLLRVRDEIRMTLAAYQTLFESSIAYGMRKALQAEQGKANLEESVETYKEEKADLERQLADLRAKAEQIERRSSELRAAEEKKHNEEIQFLKKTNQQLKSQLEGIIAPKK